MPAFRGYRRRYANRTRRFNRTRRVFRRKYGFTRRRTRNFRRAMPRFKVVKMRYSTTLSLTPVLGSTYQEYNFRANSVYDPDQTGGGHQPYSYDQWAFFYPTWSVIGSKIKWTAQSSQINDQGVPALFGISLNNNTSLPSSWTETAGLLEQPNVSYKQMPTGGTTLSRSCTMRYSAKKWWGISKITDCDGLWGETSSNPSKQTYFTCFLAATDGSSLVGNFQGVLTIDYLVLYRNPNQLDIS